MEENFLLSNFTVLTRKVKIICCFFKKFQMLLTNQEQEQEQDDSQRVPVNDVLEVHAEVDDPDVPLLHVRSCIIDLKGKLN